jgi:hypothetical protein
MKIQMGSVDSDAIKAIGFSGRTNETGTLRVQLTDGKIIDYPGVPYSLYRKFVMSKSHGKFFNQNIRGQFRED